MTNCPPKLRGDLSKWLLEISTGVYVGQLNARVRDALWKRICENIGDGQAAMVFSANNEQHLDFYVHNTSWIPVDYDGIKLMKHPSGANINNDNGGTAVSSIAKYRMNQKRRRNNKLNSYFLLDLETTGLSCEKDEIIEIGIVEVSAGKTVNTQSWLIRTENVPEDIEKLTGISQKLLISKGLELKTVLEEVFDLIEEENVLMYNAVFDIGFLKEKTESCGIDFPFFHTVDVLESARKLIKDSKDHKLETIANYLGINKTQTHRALDDCMLLNEVYSKLNEL